MWDNCTTAIGAGAKRWPWTWPGRAVTKTQQCYTSLNTLLHSRKFATSLTASSTFICLLMPVQAHVDSWNGNQHCVTMFTIDQSWPNHALRHHRILQLRPCVFLELNTSTGSLYTANLCRFQPACVGSNQPVQAQAVVVAQCCSTCFSVLWLAGARGQEQKDIYRWLLCS